MQIFSQNGPWSVPNKQNPSFYSIFHAFSRSKFPPVWPFPIENPYRPLLSIILSYRNIPSFNISILGLFLPPLIRIGSHQHGTHTGPTRVQHGSNMGPCWTHVGCNMGTKGTIVARGPQGTIVARDPIQTQNGTFSKDFTPEK